ncbi:MAG TPA: hypothetical protein VFT20_00105 [Candidatus Limnocylindrales bacterium]|nr:hypothetical protein [Candidatus Limnocylindrales bacterium]
MRRLSPLLAVIAIAALTIPVAAAPSGQLRTFGTGDVNLTGPDGATLVNDTGEYSGVYLNSKSQSAKPIGSVSFSFDYSGDIAGGAPRFSIPVTIDGDKAEEGYAFLDAINCGNTGTVSTTSPTCAVFFGSEAFPNWAAFAAAHPTYRIPPASIPFVIADQPGTYVITGIDLR